VVTYRSDVQFRSGFPDDAVYDTGDGCDVQAGRNIAEALKAALEQVDYRVSDPIDGGDHGWELDVWRGRKRLWIQISVLDAGECYLVTDNKTFWLLPDFKVYRAFLLDLQRILEADGRFSVVGWFSSGGIARGSAPAVGPFDD